MGKELSICMYFSCYISLNIPHRFHLSAQVPVSGTCIVFVPVNHTVISTSVKYLVLVIQLIITYMLK